MRISVALCTYNGEKYLQDQLDSILNQVKFSVDEIVVCDDISTDKTIQILKDYLYKYPEIFRLVINESNIGSSKNFEKAISLCTGDFIFLADQDDLWKNNKIEKTLTVFENNKSAEGVFSNADIIDDNNKLIQSKTIWDSVFFFENELQKPIDFFDVISKNGNVVTGATLCIKEEVKSFLFPFPKNVLHDEWITILLGLRKTLFYSVENLISYRLHQNQQVGMKNINKIEKKLRLKRIILNLDNPKTFKEYRFLYKKLFLKQKNILELKKYHFEFIDSDKLLVEIKIQLKDLKTKMKKMFFVQFTISTLIDKIRRKRI